MIFAISKAYFLNIPKIFLLTKGEFWTTFEQYLKPYPKLYQINPLSAISTLNWKKIVFICIDKSIIRAISPSNRRWTYVMYCVSRTLPPLYKFISSSDVILKYIAANSHYFITQFCLSDLTMNADTMRYSIISSGMISVTTEVPFVGSRMRSYLRRPCVISCGVYASSPAWIPVVHAGKSCSLDWLD